jgi:hypothetical protein
MALTNDDLLNLLREAASSLFSTDTTSLQNSLYSSATSDLNTQEEKDIKKLKDEMAQRGILDSGVWNESLGNLQGDYATQYEKAATDASNNAYTQLLNSYLAGGSLTSTALGNALNWSQLNAATDASNSASDSALYTGLGQLLGTLGTGQGGLTSLLSSTVTGVGDLIKKLFGTSTTSTVTPTVSSQTSTNTYSSPSTYKSTYTPSKTTYTQSVGQK